MSDIPKSESAERVAILKSFNSESKGCGSSQVVTIVSDGSKDDAPACYAAKSQLFSFNPTQEDLISSRLGRAKTKRSKVYEALLAPHLM